MADPHEGNVSLFIARGEGPVLLASGTIMEEPVESPRNRRRRGRRMRANFGRPLSGIRVVDLTSLLPGGITTRLLADLGAEVVKVEPPGGEAGRHFPPLDDGLSVYYRLTAGGKMVRFVDLKAPKGRGELDRLLGRADVLIHSLRSGAAQRLALSEGDVAARHPRLVQVRIAGFRRSEKAAHDLNFLASSGLLDLNRDARGQPVVPGFQIPDVAGGAWPAVAAVLTGLLERERTGRATAVTVSLHEGSLALLSFGAAEYLATGRLASDGALVTHELHPCYGLYPTKDGRLLAVACIEPKFWSGFCTLLGLPDLVPLQYASGAAGRRARRRLAAATRRRTFKEWTRRLESLDVCVTPVATLAEAVRAELRVEKGRGVFRRGRDGRYEIVPRIR
jgi:crotonobetainyl-CoA:carnitine CoA-transferase CaiB-like acyl-CoA transferase